MVFVAGFRYEQGSSDEINAPPPQWQEFCQSADPSLLLRLFTEELCRDVAVHPVTLEVAQLAGKIEGERASQGVSIAFEDLLIGSTALHLGYAVATLNVRHFQLIPGLSVVQL